MIDPKNLEQAAADLLARYLTTALAMAPIMVGDPSTIPAIRKGLRELRLAGAEIARAATIARRQAILTGGGAIGQ